jgi:hypothetical protein
MACLFPSQAKLEALAQVLNGPVDAATGQPLFQPRVGRGPKGSPRRRAASASGAGSPPPPPPQQRTAAAAAAEQEASGGVVVTAVAGGGDVFSGLYRKAMEREARLVAAEEAERRAAEVEASRRRTTGALERERGWGWTAARVRVCVWHAERSHADPGLASAACIPHAAPLPPPGCTPRPATPRPPARPAATSQRLFTALKLRRFKTIFEFLDEPRSGAVDLLALLGRAPPYGADSQQLGEDGGEGRLARSAVVERLEPEVLADVEAAAEVWAAANGLAAAAAGEAAAGR